MCFFTEVSTSLNWKSVFNQIWIPKTLVHAWPQWPREAGLGWPFIAYTYTSCMTYVSYSQQSKWTFLEVGTVRRGKNVTKNDKVSPKRAPLHNAVPGGRGPLLLLPPSCCYCCLLLPMFSLLPLPPAAVPSSLLAVLQLGGVVGDVKAFHIFSLCRISKYLLCYTAITIP